MTDCRACTRPTPDQAVLCSGCGNKLAQALGDVQALVEQLEAALARETAFGDRVGGRSAEKPLPYDQQAGIMLNSLRNTLGTWVRVLAEEGSSS